MALIILGMSVLDSETSWSGKVLLPNGNHFTVPGSFGITVSACLRLDNDWKSQEAYCILFGDWDGTHYT